MGYRNHCAASSCPEPARLKSFVLPRVVIDSMSAGHGDPMQDWLDALRAAQQAGRFGAPVQNAQGALGACARQRPFSEETDVDDLAHARRLLSPRFEIHDIDIDGVVRVEAPPPAPNVE
jgi:hypothetical protein